MRDLLRRLRGMVVIGLTWGTVWVAIGAAIAMALVALARKAFRHDSRQPRSIRDVLFAYVLGSVRDAVGPAQDPSTRGKATAG